METINLTIHWCPGHEGVYGNEAVDKIAKKAALGDIETTFDPPFTMNMVSEEGKLIMGW